LLSHFQVCWDTFDADEIWALAARERSLRSSGMLAPKANGPNLKGLEETSETTSTGLLRRSSGPLGGGGGKWQRGVALPPPDENSHRRGSRPDSDNPNDLWDDPLAATDAALDFSAFGEIPDDPKNVGEAFDFDKMTEATQAFEEELRGDRSDTDADTEGDENGDPLLHTVVVNPHRPLATVGTTIRSGSGDNVNVFEDFDDSPAPAAVKSADEDTSASSRLMKMIGVNQEETPAPKPATLEEPARGIASLNPWAAGDKASKNADDSAGTGSASIPSNPWGDSILVPNAQSQQQIDGFDLAARLQLEQQAREELLRRQSLQDAELRRRQEDEARRQAMEVRARQQAAQQGVVHSEIELVLIERISVVLENSWGRSDLMSILTALRTEDSRIVALLGNVEALRALIARHPRRIAVRQDPAFGAEMAVLLMTNAQFQQQQQQEAQARAQQEQMQRREQQLRMQASQSGQNGSRSGLPQIIANAPWFYSDPQKNIQVSMFIAVEIRFLMVKVFTDKMSRVRSAGKKCASGLKQVTSRVICQLASSLAVHSIFCPLYSKTFRAHFVFLVSLLTRRRSKPRRGRLCYSSVLWKRLNVGKRNTEKLYAEKPKRERQLNLLRLERLQRHRRLRRLEPKNKITHLRN
jgi:hypothetical protein